MLELLARKPARAVLRGGGAGDSTSLPDQPTGHANARFVVLCESLPREPAAELGRSPAGNVSPGRAITQTPLGGLTFAAKTESYAISLCYQG